MDWAMTIIARAVIEHVAEALYFLKHSEEESTVSHCNKCSGNCFEAFTYLLRDPFHFATEMGCPKPVGCRWPLQACEGHQHALSFLQLFQTALELEKLFRFLCIGCNCQKAFTKFNAECLAIELECGQAVDHTCSEVKLVQNDEDLQRACWAQQRHSRLPRFPPSCEQSALASKHMLETIEIASHVLVHLFKNRAGQPILRNFCPIQAPTQVRTPWRTSAFPSTFPLMGCWGGLRSLACTLARSLSLPLPFLLLL
mmetsp:Transcript_127616/g.221269  ORF Transcript_127616/g.221269 Transcript_127616/m.221269 type:complete len:255 (+) Transcript_127616:479-1243(+)